MWLLMYTVIILITFVKMSSFTLKSFCFYTDIHLGMVKNINHEYC